MGLRSKRVAAGLAALIVVAICIGSHAAKANLISDGDFSSPVAGGGLNTGEVNFTSGQYIGAWLVFGTGGNVAVTSSMETSNDGDVTIRLPARQGYQQFLDLTGDADDGAAMGVAQSISVLAGQLYQLSFWVGDVNFSSYPGGYAQVIVTANGSPLLTATNRNASGAAINWEQITTTITPLTDMLTLAFINDVPAGYGINGIGGIVLTPVSEQTVPEPMSLAILGAGLLGLAAFRQRKV